MACLKQPFQSYGSNEDNGELSLPFQPCGRGSNKDTGELSLISHILMSNHQTSSFLKLNLDTNSNPPPLSASVISATSVHHPDEEYSSFRDRQIESGGENLPELEEEVCRHVWLGLDYHSVHFQ